MAEPLCRATLFVRIGYEQWVDCGLLADHEDENHVTADGRVYWRTYDRAPEADPEIKP